MATRPLERSHTGRHTPPTIRPSAPHSSGSCNAPVSRVRLSGSPKRRQVASMASTCSDLAASFSVTSNSWGTKYPSVWPR